jgi:hypothetical protein
MFPGRSRRKLQFQIPIRSRDPQYRKTDDYESTAHNRSEPDKGGGNSGRQSSYSAEQDQGIRFIAIFAQNGAHPAPASAQTFSRRPKVSIYQYQ